MQGSMATKFEKAYEHLKRRELKQARILLEEVLQEQPDDIDALYNLGMTYTELGDPAKAVNTLSRCLELGQDSANVYVALGYAHSKLGNTSKSKELFLNALELEADNPYALRNLGGLYAKEAEYERAIPYLEKSMKSNPQDPNTAYGLGLCYFSMGDFGSADHYLRKTIEIDQSSPLSEMAKDLLREVASIQLKSKGFRTDAMFYCVHALNLFDKIGLEETRKIAFEIALKGQRGLDINNPSRKYTLNSLEGTFSGLQLVTYMYVGFKRIASDMDVGIDLSEEYAAALKVTKLRRSDEFTSN
jgi:tetratricopeptide (TPR) repeat protein